MISSVDIKKGGVKVYYADEVIEEVRSRNDIVDVLGSYVNLKKEGQFLFSMLPVPS